MESVNPEVLDRLSALAEELPKEQQGQLMELVSQWRDDLRRAPRHDYSELLNITSSKGASYANARDVSATGVFIETDAEFEIGEKVSMLLTFISAPNPVRLAGTVVRITPEGVGVQFDALSSQRVNDLEGIIARHALILRKK